MTRKMLVLPNARWKRTAANASRRAMNHRAVGCVAATVVPALHAAGKAFALAHAADIHQFAGFEIFHQYAVADFGFIFRFVDADFLQHFHGRRAGFFEVPGHSFVDALRLDEFHQAELRGFVAVLIHSAALYHHTWPRLQHGAADQRAVVGEDLRHPQLDSDNSVDRHLLFLSLRSMSLTSEIGCVPLIILLCFFSVDFQLSTVNFLLLPRVAERLDFYINSGG